MSDLAILNLVINSGSATAASAAMQNLSVTAKIVQNSVNNSTNTFNQHNAVIDRTRTGYDLLIKSFAGIYAIRAAFTALDTYLIKPLEDLSERFVDATEKSRKFELAIGSITGLTKAREINNALVSASRTQVADVESLRKSAEVFAALPTLAAKLNNRDAVQQIVTLNRTVSRLAALDPAQGQNGATIAVREVLEGGGGDAFNSLRRRFGLTASTLSRAVGASLDDIRNDPALALKAIETVTQALVPDSIVNASGNLFSVKVQKIRDALDQALVRVGDSGAYDKLTAKISKVSDSLFAALDSQAFEAQARKVSNAASRSIDSIMASVDKFLRAATGASADDSLTEVVGDAVAKSIERLANIIDNIPAISAKIGTVAGEIGSQVGKLIDALTDIADAVRNPEKVAGKVKDYALARADSFLENSAYSLSGLDKLGESLGNKLGEGLTKGLEKINLNKNTEYSSSGADFGPNSKSLIQSQNEKEGFGLIGQLIRKLDSPTPFPNFGSTLLSSNAAFGRLDELTADRTDALTQLNQAGKGAFIASKNAIDTLQKQMLDTIDQFDNALDDADRRIKLTTDPAEINQLQGSIESVKRAREKLVESFNLAGQSAADGLVEAATNFRRGLAAGLVNLPLGGNAALISATGQNAQVNAALKRLDALGIKAGPTDMSSWKLSQQQEFITKLGERNLTDLANQSNTGAISVGMSADAIRRAVGSRPDDRMIQQNQADLIQSQLMPLQESILNKANARLSQNPQDPLAIQDAAKATQQYAELAAKLADLKDKVGELGPAFRQFADSARNSVESGLGNVLSSLGDGIDGIREAVGNMVKSIVQEFAQMQAHLLVQSLVGDFGKTQSSGQMGSVGGIFGSIFSAFAGSSTPAAAAYNGFAFNSGTVVPFAFGGVPDLVNQPTYFPMSNGRRGLMGEAGPEAVMPLKRDPRTGKLGVAGGSSHSSQTIVNMNISTPDADSFRKADSQIKRKFKRGL